MIRCPTPTFVQLSVDPPQPLKGGASGKAKPNKQATVISSDDDHVAVQAGPHTPYKRVVNPADKNKPRLEDFTPTTKKIANKLRSMFELYVAVEDMFPDEDDAKAKVDELFAETVAPAPEHSKIARRGERFKADEDYRQDMENSVRTLCCEATLSSDAVLSRAKTVTLDSAVGLLGRRSRSPTPSMRSMRRTTRTRSGKSSRRISCMTGTSRTASGRR